MCNVFHISSLCALCKLIGITHYAILRGVCGYHVLLGTVVRAADKLHLRQMETSGAAWHSISFSGRTQAPQPDFLLLGIIQQSHWGRGLRTPLRESMTAIRNWGECTVGERDAIYKASGSSFLILASFAQWCLCDWHLREKNLPLVMLNFIQAWPISRRERAAPVGSIGALRRDSGIQQGWKPEHLSSWQSSDVTFCHTGAHQWPLCDGVRSPTPDLSWNRLPPHEHLQQGDSYPSHI